MHLQPNIWETKRWDTAGALGVYVGGECGGECGSSSLPVFSGRKEQVKWLLDRRWGKVRVNIPYYRES
jgi:hypothetical protein